MINQRELMAGNYCHCGSVTLRVVSIFQSHFKASCESGITRNSIQSDIRPIKLTEEWLFRMGFYKDRSNVYLCRNEEAFRIRITRQEVVLFQQGNCVYIPSIKYVHRLQNLYNTLTQKELEIKDK